MSEISDGYHTFNELYTHRALLMIALMKSNPEISWVSKEHDDGSMFEGMFIVGMSLPAGDISYHLEGGLFECAVNSGAKLLQKAPAWNGHTSDDVLDILEDFINDQR